MSTYSWGLTSNGQLGLGDTSLDTEDTTDDGTIVTRPQELLMFRNQVVHQIACGLRHSVFLLANGTVFSCGSNDCGQLGHGKHGRIPGQVTSLETFTIRRVACGDALTVVTTDTGSLLSWGDDRYGQCGWGSTTRENKTNPRLLKYLAMHHVVQVACGSSHCIALTKNGRLFTWGNNTHGQLGLGNGQRTVNERPAEVTSLHGLPVRQVACGGGHTFVVSVSGTMFGWGRNQFGQLGVSDTQDRAQPTLLKSLRSQRVRYITCGQDHTAVLTAEGGVFTFGAASGRQLGHNSSSNEINPRKVFELMGSEVTQVACGRYHTLAFISSSQRVLSFGLLSHNQSPTPSRPSFRRSLSTPFLVRGPWMKTETNADVIVGTDQIDCGDDRVEGAACSCRHNETGSECCGRIQAPRLDEVAVEDDIIDVDQMPDSDLEQTDHVHEPGERIEDCNSQVTAIYSGGSQCFLVLSPRQGTDSNDHRFIPPDSLIATINTSFVDSLIAAPVNDSLSESVMSDIEEIFSSAACLNASFLTSDDRHYGSSRQNHGIDLDAAREQFGRLANKNAILRYIAQILDEYLLPTLPSSPPDIEALRLYLLLMESPVFIEPTPDRYHILVVRFGEALHRLTGAAAKVISQWWSTLRPRHLNRILTTYKVCMMGQLCMRPKEADRPTLRRNIKTCLEVLSKLFKMNNENNEILPYYLFYVNELTQNVGIREHFLEWLQRPAGMECQDVNFCDYPFVLDANAKTQLLNEDAVLQMQNAIEDVHRRNIVTYFIDPINPYLVLNIDRNNIVSSTLSELSRQGSMDVKKPLRVIFLGEEAVDIGGVKKEFFMLILREILSPAFGMFHHFQASESIWFNSKSFEDSEMFCLVGIIVGLAIYNLTIITLPFPLALYKKLLKRPANTLEDFKQLDPLVANHLQNLLDMDGEEEIVDLCLTFQISLENFGEVETSELKLGGADIVVTLENRQEYVDRYVDYFLNTSVEQKYQHFSKGILHVCGGRVFDMFHPQELMNMVIGDDQFDWEDLEKNVEYKGEYYRQHPTIKMFWDVFREMDLDQKKKFLIFLTGTDRIPIQGMKTLHTIIQPVRSGKEFFPVAHTCFNLLDLPIYTNKEKLREKLLTAIQHAQGFTLA